MSEALLAAVVVVGVLTCLNLVLTYGVIRRLREHEERLADGHQGGGGEIFGKPAAGTAIPEFTATTVDGAEVSRRQLAAGAAYIGFFTAHCAPCRERLPEFLEFLASNAGRDRTLVVLGGAQHDSWDVVGTARGGAGVAHVVIEDAAPGTLAELFEIDRFPSMLALDDGVVSANAAVLAQLPTASRA